MTHVAEFGPQCRRCGGPQPDPHRAYCTRCGEIVLREFGLAQRLRTEVRGDPDRPTRRVQPEVPR